MMERLKKRIHAIRMVIRNPNLLDEYKSALKTSSNYYHETGRNLKELQMKFEDTNGELQFYKQMSLEGISIGQKYYDKEIDIGVLLEHTHELQNQSTVYRQKAVGFVTIKGFYTDGVVNMIETDVGKIRADRFMDRKSLGIQGNCSVFELDKGVLYRCDTASNPPVKCKPPAQKKSLSIKSALSMTKVNFKRQLGKMVSLVLAMTVAASCLIVNFSGMLSGSSYKAFQQLLEKQGNSILNLDIVSSFMGAAGTGEDQSANSQSVTQDISRLMEQYQNDPRVEGITMISPISDAVVNLDGKDFIIEFSGQAPVFNKIVAGTNADNREHQVVLPEALVKKMGRTNEEIIGKELSFLGTVYNWNSGAPVEMPISFAATVSGVADTSYGIEIEGEVIKFEHEDSLFLSLAVMKDIYAQAEKENPSYSFTIRPTSPENYLELYDELMAMGIVPLGRVEMIRDIVGLKGDALAQTGISYALIAVLSVLAALSVCLGCSVMRKKEYAVYQLSGFTKADITALTLVEYMGMFLVSGVLCAVMAMLLGTPMWLGLALSLGVSVLCFGENSLLATRVNPLTALKTGGR